MRVKAVGLHAGIFTSAISLMAVLSCGTQPGRVLGYSVRDSAGVTIVENTTGTWTREAAWRISDDPVLNIGASDGESEYLFYRVRDARRLHDGRIVVANSGTSELRFFNAAGEYLVSSGQDGEGPGEFDTLGWIREYRGDSILAYDLGRFGGSILSAYGQFGRSFRLLPPGDGSPVFGFDVFSDGTIIGKAESYPPGWELGIHRNDDVYFSFSADGEFIDTLGSYAGKDIIVQVLGEGGRGPRISGSPPFGRKPAVVVRGDQFCVALAESYEISCYESDGRLAQIIRRNTPPRSVTEADFERYLARRLARMRNDAERQRWEPRIREIPLPELMPPYDTLLVDSENNLWVREHPFGEQDQRRWSVFDARGAMLGTLDFPAGLRVTHVGDDFILGIWQDEMGIEQVRMYDLAKPR